MNIHLTTAMLCLILLLALMLSNIIGKTEKEIKKDCQNFQAFMIGEEKFKCEKVMP